MSGEPRAKVFFRLQVVLLRPGGLGEGSPDRPLADGATTQGMWCQLTAPDAFSGQISITIWPLYSLYNALPTPVQWRLSNRPPVNNSSSSSSSGGVKLLSDTGNKTGQGAQAVEEQELGVLQPGSETPLAFALGSHQTLSLALTPQQDSPFRGQSGLPAPTGAHSWSVPLHTCDPGGNAGFPDGLWLTDTDRLPQAGLWQALDIPTSRDSSLSCMLVAQPGLHQAAPVCLCLVPHAVLHNSLPFEVSLVCPGAEQEIHIPAGTSRALDWSHLQYRPKKAALAVTESSHGARLRSHAFALDGNHDSQLTLSTSAAPSSSSGGRVTTFHATVRVQNDPFEIRSGPGGVGGGVTMEVTHISITPGCFVSNLTQHQISLQLQGQQHQATAPLLPSLWQKPQDHLPQPQSSPTPTLQPLGLPHQPQGHPPQPQSSQSQLPEPKHQAPWHLTCAPSQTYPILNAWRYPLQPPPQRPKPPLKPPTTSLAVTVQLDPAAPSPSIPPSPQDSDFTGHQQRDSQTDHLQAVDVPLLSSCQTHIHAAYHEATVTLMQPSGRAHLLLPHPHTDPQGTQDGLLLAYRCMLSQGRLHLVFFIDPQPPCVLHNAASEAVLVVWCTLRRDKHGELHPVESEEWIAVAAGGAVDCSPRSCMPPGHGHPGM